MRFAVGSNTIGQATFELRSDLFADQLLKDLVHSRKDSNQSVVLFVKMIVFLKDGYQFPPFPLMKFETTPGMQKIVLAKFVLFFKN